MLALKRLEYVDADADAARPTRHVYVNLVRTPRLLDISLCCFEVWMFLLLEVLAISDLLPGILIGGSSRARPARGTSRT